MNRQGVVGNTSEANVFAFTLNWNLTDKLDFKSITSYLGDEGTSNTIGGEEWSATAPGTGQRTTLDTTRLGFPLFAPLLSDPLIGDGYAGFFRREEQSSRHRAGAAAHVRGRVAVELGGGRVLLAREHRHPATSIERMWP